MKKLLLLFMMIFTISACVNNSEEKHKTYNSELDRFIYNIYVKEKGDHYIIYEYKDIRVDELAGFAARYCDETYFTPAHLKEIKLHKNNSRLATFHCGHLKER